MGPPHFSLSLSLAFSSAQAQAEATTGLDQEPQHLSAFASSDVRSFLVSIPGNAEHMFLAASPQEIRAILNDIEVQYPAVSFDRLPAKVRNAIIKIRGAQNPAERSRVLFSETYKMFSYQEVSYDLEGDADTFLEQEAPPFEILLPEIRQNGLVRGDCSQFISVWGGLLSYADGYPGRTMNIGAIQFMGGVEITGPHGIVRDAHVSGLVPDGSGGYLLIDPNFARPVPYAGNGVFRGPAADGSGDIEMRWLYIHMAGTSSEMYISPDASERHANFVTQVGAFQAGTNDCDPRTRLQCP